jgi:hypothetical protein
VARKNRYFLSQELSVKNARILQTIIGCGNTPFFSTDFGKNICFNGFSLTSKQYLTDF